jgi:hypothetical protein
LGCADSYPKCNTIWKPGTGSGKVLHL